MDKKKAEFVRDYIDKHCDFDIVTRNEVVNALFLTVPAKVTQIENDFKTGVVRCPHCMQTIVLKGNYKQHCDYCGQLIDKEFKGVK